MTKNAAKVTTALEVIQVVQSLDARQDITVH